MSNHFKKNISIAKLEDIPQLVALENICFTTDQLTAAQCKRFITKTSAFFAVYKDNKKLLGSILILLRKNSKRARLYSLAVHPDAEGKGIAKKLCAVAYSCVKQKQYILLNLEVRKNNKRAIQFYLKQGFNFIGEYLHFYEDGEDAFKMSRKL